MFENDEGELHWWMIPLIIIIVLVVIFINGRADTRKGMLSEIGFEPDEATLEKWAKRDELHDAQKVIAEAERRLKEHYPPKNYAHQYEKVEVLISIIQSTSYDEPWRSLHRWKGSQLAVDMLREKYKRLKRENR